MKPLFRLLLFHIKNIYSFRKIFLTIEISNRKELKSLHENRLELMKYRLESAQERLNSAKILLDCGNYKIR